MTTRWGILGTGRILAKLVGGFRLAKGVELHAVASRELSRARAAAQEFGIPVAHGSYDALLADPGIDTVLNALHNGLHCEWTCRALEAGKHVLCEKPLACNAGEAERMFAAAHANDRLLMEGFMYRFHPQIPAAVEQLAGVGHVRSIRCAYVGRGREKKNPRYRKECGGGALMDLGCYTVNLARLFAGSEPVGVTANAHWDEETGVDLTLTGTMEFANGVTAQIKCSLEAEDNGEYGAEVVGEAGRILVPHPWLPPSSVGEVLVERAGKTETLRFPTPGLLTPFAGEIEHFATCVQAGKSPMISEPDSLGNACAMDALLTSARNGSKMPRGERR